MATGRQCAVAALDSKRYVSVTTLLACQQEHKGGVLLLHADAVPPVVRLVLQSPLTFGRSIGRPFKKKNRRSPALLLDPAVALDTYLRALRAADQDGSAANENACEYLRS